MKIESRVLGSSTGLEPVTPLLKDRRLKDGLLPP